MNFLSPMHLAVILIIALLLFGNRLPEVARSLGRSINEFKRGMRDIQDDFDEEPPREKLNPPREHDQTVSREDSGDREAEREKEHVDSGRD